MKRVRCQSCLEWMLILDGVDAADWRARECEKCHEPLRTPTSGGPGAPTDAAYNGDTLWSDDAIGRADRD